MSQFYGPMGQYPVHQLSQEDMLDQLLHEQRYDKRQRPTLTNDPDPVPVNFTLTVMSMTLAYQQPNGYAITVSDTYDMMFFLVVIGFSGFYKG